MGTRVVPIPALAVTMSTSTSGPDAMDISSSPTASAPSHIADHETNGKTNSRPNQPSSSDRSAADSSSNMPAPPTTTSSAIHQPKIVQTAFIHKLYK